MHTELFVYSHVCLLDFLTIVIIFWFYMILMNHLLIGRNRTVDQDYHFEVDGWTFLMMDQASAVGWSVHLMDEFERRTEKILPVDGALYLRCKIRISTGESENRKTGNNGN